MRFLSKDDRRLISQTGIFGGIAKKRPDSLTFSLHLSFSLYRSLASSSVMVEV